MRAPDGQAHAGSTGEYLQVALLLMWLRQLGLNHKTVQVCHDCLPWISNFGKDEQSRKIAGRRKWQYSESTKVGRRARASMRLIIHIFDTV